MEWFLELSSNCEFWIERECRGYGWVKEGYEMNRQLSNADWTEGRFERKSVKALPPCQVDCSHWLSDLPDDEWSAGYFARACQAMPPVSTTLEGNDDPCTGNSFGQPQESFLLGEERAFQIVVIEVISKFIADARNLETEISMETDIWRFRKRYGIALSKLQNSIDHLAKMHWFRRAAEKYGGKLGSVLASVLEASDRVQNMSRIWNVGLAKNTRELSDADLLNTIREVRSTLQQVAVSLKVETALIGTSILREQGDEPLGNLKRDQVLERR